MQERIESEKRIANWQILLFCIYIFLSFYEAYLTRFLGNSTKFYLLFVLAIFLYQGKFKIRKDKYWKMFFAWFIYKTISLSWSSMANTDFQMHFLSQIGMVLLIIVLTGRKQEKEFIHAVVQSTLWISFLYGILSIFFKASYIDERFVARQVLTLFGQQNDPNNCAAFLLVGIALGIYSATIERRKIILNSIIVAVNTYALLLTSSRAGFITIGAVVLCILFFPQKGHKAQIKKAIQKVAIVIVVVIVLAYIIQRFLPQANFERLFMISGYEGGSGRDYKWEVGFELISQRPLFGWGWSGYSLGFSALHNTFLTSLCDVGIVGTLLLIMPMLSICYESFRKKNLLALIIFISGVLPAVFIDSINKRFFWNAIVISIMILQIETYGSEVCVWNASEDD